MKMCCCQVGSLVVQGGKIARLTRRRRFSMVSYLVARPPPQPVLPLSTANFPSKLSKPRVLFACLASGNKNERKPRETVSGEIPASFGSSIRGGRSGKRDQPPQTEARKRVKELELAMNKRMLKHSVTAAGANGGRAVVVPGPRLDVGAKRDIIEDGLEGRSTADELANQGILQVMKCDLGTTIVRVFVHVGVDINSLNCRYKEVQIHVSLSEKNNVKAFETRGLGRREFGAD